MFDMLSLCLDGLSYLFEVTYYTDILLASVLILTAIYIIRFIRGY